MAAGQPQLGRAVDGGGHPAQRLAVLMAVLAHTDVHLGQTVQADRVQRIDQEPQLDAVAHREGQALQQGAAGRVLTAQRLDETGQLRPVEIEQRPGDQFGDAAALTCAGALAADLQRTVVHRLDEMDVRVGQQRADDAGDKGGREFAQIGVDEADDVAAGGEQRAPQDLALAGQRGNTGQHAVPVDDRGAGRRRDLGRTVGGARIQHHQLVDQRNGIGHQLGAYRGHDRADRGLLVQRRQDDADRTAALALRLQQPPQWAVGRGPGTAAQPALHLFQHVYDSSVTAGPAAGG